MTPRRRWRSGCGSITRRPSPSSRFSGARSTSSSWTRGPRPRSSKARSGRALACRRIRPRRSRTRPRRSRTRWRGRTRWSGSRPPSGDPRVREIAVFGGTAHPALAAEICAYLEVPQRPVRFKRFANDCLEVQLQSNCRERDVFLIQPLVPPVQEHLVELLLMADAARGASAARVTVVMPHYAYASSDKKDAPRISIGGRLVADLLVTAGVNRVLTLTLHSPQVHGFFSVPVDHLHALRELAAYFRRRDLSRAVVLSPDLGYAKDAAAFARRLGVPVAAGAKERFSDQKVSISAIIGDVADRDVIVLDDE